MPHSDNAEESNDSDSSSASEYLGSSSSNRSSYLSEHSVSDHDVSSGAQLLIASYDFRGIHEDDLSFSAGDIFVEDETSTLEEKDADARIGWLYVWTVVDGVRVTEGYVPANYVRPEGEMKPEIKPPKVIPRPVDEWTTEARKAVVLQMVANEMLPPGFRMPFLGEVQRDDNALLSAALIPKLDRSGLAFLDLDQNEHGELSKIDSKVDLSFSMVEALQIPLPSTDGQIRPFEILHRCVRCAFYDGDKVASNVHTFRATVEHDDSPTWKFKPTQSKGQITSCAVTDCDVVVRCNSTSQHLSLVIELSMMLRWHNTGLEFETSCGWTQVPLVSETSKPFEIMLHGGTIYEPNVPLTSMSRSMIITKKSKQQSGPRVLVKLSNHKSSGLIRIAQDLPSTCIVEASTAELISLYRQLLVMHAAPCSYHPKTYIGPRVDPCLKTFVDIIDDSHLVNHLKRIWTASLKSLRKKDRKNSVAIHKCFGSVLIERISPLLYLKDCPGSKTGDLASETKRDEHIFRFLHPSGVGVIQQVSSRSYEPFEIGQVTFDAIPASSRHLHISHEPTIQLNRCPVANV